MELQNVLARSLVEHLLSDLLSGHLARVSKSDVSHLLLKLHSRRLIMRLLDVVLHEVDLCALRLGRVRYHGLDITSFTRQLLFRHSFEETWAAAASSMISFTSRAIFFLN